MLSRNSRVLVFVCSLIAIESAVALSPDERLLRMIPPGTQVVAGIRAPSTPDSRGASGYFVLITRRNHADIDDFAALTGADPTRRIREAILISAADQAGELSEHSLLARGTFDQHSVFRFADGTKVRRHSYREIPVLEIQPFERERSYFNDIRWLAIIDPNFAVFGTIAIVKQELDRDLDGSSIDPSLTARLARLNEKDHTWSLVSPPMPRLMSTSFDLLDPKLASIVHDGDSIQLGIELGRQIRLEYEVANVAVQTPTENEPPPTTPAARLSLLTSEGDSRVTDMVSSKSIRGVLKISRDRYNRWLEDVRAMLRKRHAGL